MNLFIYKLISEAHRTNYELYVIMQGLGTTSSTWFHTNESITLSNVDVLNLVRWIGIPVPSHHQHILILVQKLNAGHQTYVGILNLIVANQEGSNGNIRPLNPAFNKRSRITRCWELNFRTVLENHRSELMTKKAEPNDKLVKTLIVFNWMNQIGCSWSWSFLRWGR